MKCIREKLAARKSRFSSSNRGLVTINRFDLCFLDNLSRSPRGRNLFTEIQNEFRNFPETVFFFYRVTTMANRNTQWARKTAAGVM